MKTTAGKIVLAIVIALGALAFYLAWKAYQQLTAAEKTVANIATGAAQAVGEAIKAPGLALAALVSGNPLVKLASLIANIDFGTGPALIIAPAAAVNPTGPFASGQPAATIPSTGNWLLDQLYMQSGAIIKP